MGGELVDLFKKKPRPSRIRRPGSPGDDQPRSGESRHQATAELAVERHLWAGLEPVAFARPRFDGRSKRVFSAPRYERFKHALRATLVSNHPPYEHPCEVEIELGMGPPGQKPKWRWLAFLAGRWLHTSRPDIDNLAKSILDAMNGALWKDDSQCYRLAVEKVYSEAPFIQLTVHWHRQAAKGDR